MSAIGVLECARKINETRRLTHSEGVQLGLLPHEKCLLKSSPPQQLVFDKQVVQTDAPPKHVPPVPSESCCQLRPLTHSWFCGSVGLPGLERLASVIMQPPSCSAATTQTAVINTAIIWEALMRLPLFLCPCKVARATKKFIPVGWAYFWVSF